MGDDNEESFSRPAKRRRISHRGSPDTFSGPPRSGPNSSPVKYGDEDGSTPLANSMLYGARRGSSQADLHPHEADEVDIVETSDNEEILLEDNYNDHDDYATTFARTSPRAVSNAPTSSPYHESRLPIASELDQDEAGAITNNSTPHTKLTIRNTVGDLPLLVSSPVTLGSSQVQPPSSILFMSPRASSPGIGRSRAGPSNSSHFIDTFNRSIRTSGAKLDDASQASNDWLETSRHSLSPKSPSHRSSPRRPSSSQLSKTSGTASPRRSPPEDLILTSFMSVAPNPTKRTSKGPSNNESVLDLDPPSPSQRSELPNISSGLPKSPSLTPPPPTPPRRRTRESNKTFAPYTAYRQQYGEAAFTELRRLEELEASRRLNGQRSTVVNPDEDANYAASQSQIEEESQDQTQISRVLPVKPRTNGSALKPRTSIQKARPSVPVPLWEARRPTSPHARHEPMPLKAHNPNAPRRFVDHDGSPVRAGKEKLVKPGESYKGIVPQEKTTPFVKTARPITGEEALLQLYAEESDQDDQMAELDYYDAVFNDMEALEEMADPSGAPTTDPDTNDSDMDAEPTQLRDNRDLSTSPQAYSTGNMERPDPERSSNSDEDDEDPETRKRKRILQRVLPAVMIKRSAEEERKRELKRQRKRRDDERARRTAQGLGDSDPDEDGPIILPGQSRTKRVANAEGSMWGSRIGGEEVIDLTSDRESLDNDDPMAPEEPSAVFSSDEDGVGMRAEEESDMEAMEDNTFIGGARSRNDKARTRLIVQRRGPINRRNRNLRQSRIDRMLNSANATRRRSKHGGGTKHHRGATSRGGDRNSLALDGRHNSSRHRPPNTYIISNPTHAQGQVQTTLPFESIPQDHIASGRYREASDQRHKKNPSSSRMNGTTSITNNFTELFDVLASRSHVPRVKGVSKRSKTIRELASKQIHSKAISGTNGQFHESAPSTPLAYADSGDPDAKIEISLNSALAFGMRRSRLGFSFGPSYWITQGKLLDLVRVLCGTSEPARPLPCYVSTLHFDATTSIPDLQLQFPTVCDLIFASIERPSGDEDRTNMQQLMRFMCLYVSWSVLDAQEDTPNMLNFMAEQVRALMDRVEEHLTINGKTGIGFDSTLLSIHWFAVEISNRIAKVVANLRRNSTNDVIILSDGATDQYTITLMARLLEFGIRRSMASLQSQDDQDIGKYAAELWIALIHTTILQPTTSEDSKARSNTFWRLVLQSFDQCNRQFPSAAHETEFIFATIFSLSSISSIDNLGFGQETRVLLGYWPIVSRALSNIELSLQTDRTKRLSQSTLAAKDTYIGMLFARCNVLAFRWEWSLQDSQETKQLFELLRGALKDRRFMNLIHEQSDFPYFITRRNLRMLHEFEPKDSIQTIVIKLMLRKVLDAQEDMKSAKKWISLLASTSALEFTKATPPTQKELSTLFNQFTIKFVLLYVNPDAGNARATINSSKRIINFQNADDRSRMVCIRSAMIFGRFCRHFRLPLDEVVQWMAEMGLILLEEHKLMGAKASVHQKKETGTLCALLLGSLRDVLQTNSLEDGENHHALATAFYLENSIGMISFVTKLIPLTRDWDASLAEEVALLLMTIFQSRSAVFPPPKLPIFPLVVFEEESQEDYGFDPIDLDDPTFAEVMKTHDNGREDGEFWNADSKLAVAIAELINPVASLIGRLGYAESGERKKANVELWMQCWARIGAVTQAHNLKSWDYFLQRSPDALGRVADLAWRQQTEPVFLLEILRSDMRVYASDKERFIRGWFITVAADLDHILPSYTYTLFRVDGLKHFLFENVPFRRDMTEDDYDDDTYVNTRFTIFEVVLGNLERSILIQEKNPELVRRNVEALEAVSETLKLMRHNISNALGEPDDALREYAGFCRDVVFCLKGLAIAEDARLVPFLLDPWVAALERYVLAE